MKTALMTAPIPQKHRYLQEIQRARARTDSLFDLIPPESIYERPIPERHRVIFYFGHLEAFDWNKICRWALDVPAFQASFDSLFEAGIDPEPGHARADQPSDWPSIEEVRRYNARARATIDDVLSDAPQEIVNIAIEHRWMHCETLAYLLHNLPYDRKMAAHQAPATAGPMPAARMIEIPAGPATLGQSRDSFGWDNEFDQHVVAVPAFRISRYKVTNGEYLEYVTQGGEPPAFWTLRRDQWFYRGMFDLIPLPHDWPVYVTHEQASAYAAWRGFRLPTEAEFHRAAYATPRGDERFYPWGDAPPSAFHGNFDFERWDPASVISASAGDSAFGVAQLLGNGWEWTSTPFHPFDGFKAREYYPGYSRDFFDGRHFVLKGASPRTATRYLRRSFRNWFRPNYPYLYSTFRLAAG